MTPKQDGPPIRRKVLATLALAALLAPLTVAAQTQPETADPVLGAVLYAEHCAECHGAELQGQPDWRARNADGTLRAPPHDETGHTWHHGNETLFTYTHLGGQVYLEDRGLDGSQSAMPGFGEVLSDAEIWHILGFIKSTWSEQAKEVQAERTAAER